MQKQEKSESRFASEKAAFSKEQEIQAKRWERENEIHKVRELDLQKREEKLRRDKKISSKEKEFIRDRNQSLLKKETYVSSIEVTIRTDLKAISERENTVEKREKAVEKSEKSVEKTVAKQKKAGEQLTMERVGLEKAQMQVKRDCESMFERETKLWEDKKELVKDKHTFDAKVLQSKKDIKREQEFVANEEKLEETGMQRKP